MNQVVSSHQPTVSCAHPCCPLPASEYVLPFHSLPQVGFSGWARMAQTIDRFGVTEVRKPKVGENKPAAVTGERGRAWGQGA